MSTEWTEETVLPYMFKEVEVRDNKQECWRKKGDLIGFCTQVGFLIDGPHVEKQWFTYMRPIKEPTTRPLTCDEYHGEPIRFAKHPHKCAWNIYAWDAKGVHRWLCNTSELRTDTWQELADGWEYYKDGEWQAMEVTE